MLRDAGAPGPRATSFLNELFDVIVLSEAGDSCTEGEACGGGGIGGGVEGGGEETTDDDDDELFNPNLDLQLFLIC